VLPLPSFALVFLLAGLGLNPWFLALSASLGATIGEITGFIVGAGGRKLAEKRQEKKKGILGFFKKDWFDKAKSWSDNRGIFVVIVLFAATPLPHDVVGILAGAIGYDVRKFLGATFIGKMIMFSFLAWAGFFGIDMIMELLGSGI
jgi:membrane protein YqaA with SNARE-associated domain